MHGSNEYQNPNCGYFWRKRVVMDLGGVGGGRGEFNSMLYFILEEYNASIAKILSYN